MPVDVNGVQMRMIVDTGATRTTLTHLAAERAGIRASTEDGAMVTSANGVIWVAGAKAKRVALGEASATNVSVYVQQADTSGLGANVDGLLGLSFLGNFKFSANNGVLELAPLD